MMNDFTEKPESFETLKQRVQEVRKSGDPKAAIALGRQLLTMAIEANSSQQIAEARLELGTALYRVDPDEGYSNLHHALNSFLTSGQIDLAAQASNTLGNLHRIQARFDYAIECYLEALEISRRIGNIERTMSVLTNLAGTYVESDRQTDAIPIYEELTRLCHETGNRAAESMNLSNYAKCLFTFNKDERAFELIAEAIRIASELNKEDLIAIANESLALMFMDIGRFAEASEHFRQVYGWFEKTNHARMQANCLCNLASCELMLHDYENSVKHSRTALKIAREYGDLRMEAHTLKNIGFAHFGARKWDHAYHTLHQAIDLLRNLGDQPTEASCLMTLSDIAYELNDSTEALMYLETAEQLASQFRDNEFLAELQKRRVKLSNQH